MKLLHSADWHISKNADKLEETVRCIRYLLDVARTDPPDLFCLSGDLLDEMDGRIALDSEPARVAIDLVTSAASIAPVVIVRGTKSHDRESPFIFKHIKTLYPIHVAADIQQVALVRDIDGMRFVPIAEMNDHPFAVAAFSLVPSVDKSYLMAHSQMSISEGNLQTRELLHDLFTGLGLVNYGLQPDVPRILVTHGMVTGAQFSTGQTAVGEDLEFGVNDLQRANCDYVALGHVHKMQCFPGNICYSGSPGRLNFGETEEKGFLMVEFIDRAVKEIKFHPTPARRFALHSIEWGEGGKDAILAEADKCAASCQGADVRFRYTVPEENKHEISRDALAALFLEAGARKVKVEATVIPLQRTRAAGISRAETLPEKVALWGVTTGTEIPQRVMDLAGRIEGMDVDELVADAERAISGVGLESMEIQEVAA